jgi:hypothetical protein
MQKLPMKRSIIAFLTNSRIVAKFHTDRFTYVDENRKK